MFLDSWDEISLVKYLFKFLHDFSIGLFFLNLKAFFIDSGYENFISLVLHISFLSVFLMFALS